MLERHPHHRSTPGPWDQRRPPGVTPTIALGEGGLTMGAGTCLVRMAKGGRLAPDAGRERLLALLSIATNRAVPPAVLTSIEAAAEFWYRGDKALANLRLIFANLPRLGDPGDALRLQQAASLLDGGMTPRALLKALVL